MSAIYMTNTNSTNVLSGAVLPNSINKKVGNAFFWLNNSVLILKPGYYKIEATVTFSAEEAGDVILSIQKNGIDIPGIIATETITTPNTEIRTVTLQGILRVLCHEGEVVLTLVNKSESAITTSNVSISIID